MKASAGDPVKKADINDTYSDCMEIKAGGNNRLFCPSGQKQKYLIKKYFQDHDDKITRMQNEAAFLQRPLHNSVKITVMNDSSNRNFSKLQKKSASNSYQNQKSLKTFTKREY